MWPNVPTINYIVSIWCGPRPQVNKDSSGRAFQGLRDHLPGAGDKGQTSLRLGSDPYYTALTESFHTLITFHPQHSPMYRASAEVAMGMWPQPGPDAEHSALKPTLLPQLSWPRCGPTVAASLG